MGRRLFRHLIIELSHAVGQHVSRYDLWVYLHEVGLDPENLSPEEAVAFCRGPLAEFLAEKDLSLEPRACRRLQREIGRHGGCLTDPYERLERLESY